MKVLLTGGTGLVGSELGKKLVRAGHQVFVLTRSKEKANLTCPYPHTALTWDELETHPEVEKFEGIIHLAGAGIFDKRWTKSHKERIRNSRVNGTAKIVHIANSKCKNLKAFISTSAVGIYGEADNRMVDEDHSKSNSFLGKVCQDWEAPVHNIQNSRWVILRVGIVFSEKGGALSEIVPPIQHGYGGALAGGKFYQSWIDIDDLTNLYVFALEKNIRGIYNATAPNPQTNKKITELVAQKLDTFVPPSVPYLGIRIVVGEVAPHLVESQTISSEKIQKEGFKFQFPKVEDSIAQRVPKLKGTEKRFTFEQYIPKKKEEIFPFFAEVKNLEQITPPLLRFQVLGSSTDEVQEGTEIFYKLKINGIPLRWNSVIKEWDPPHKFSDSQIKGPYKKWFHVHKFEDLGEGTLMTDQIDFKIPLGVVGYLASAWKVLKDVNHIFEYRRKILHTMYNKNQSSNLSS